MNAKPLITALAVVALLSSAASQPILTQTVFEILKTDEILKSKTSIWAKEHYAYQFSESKNLWHWNTPNQFVRGKNSTIEYYASEFPSFIRITTKEAFAPLKIQEDLARKIFDEGEGNTKFIYIPDEGWDGLLQSNLTDEDITIAIEASWHWAPPPYETESLNIVRYTVDISNYYIPQIGFNGHPYELATLLNEPVPYSQFTDIYFKTPKSGYFIRNDRETNGSLKTSEPIPFEIP